MDSVGGGKYIDNGVSYVINNLFKKQNAGKQFDLAIGYELGVNKFAVGYYQYTKKFGTLKRDLTLPTPLARGTNLGNGKANVLSTTYDRTIVPGLAIYGEINYYTMRTTENFLLTNKPNDRNPRNKGHAVIIGTKLSF